MFRTLALLAPYFVGGKAVKIKPGSILIFGVGAAVAIGLATWQHSNWYLFALAPFAVWAWLYSVEEINKLSWHYKFTECYFGAGAQGPVQDLPVLRALRTRGRLLPDPAHLPDRAAAGHVPVAHPVADAGPEAAVEGAHLPPHPPQPGQPGLPVLPVQAAPAARLRQQLHRDDGHLGAPGVLGPGGATGGDHVAGDAHHPAAAGHVLPRSAGVLHGAGHVPGSSGGCRTHGAVAGRGLAARQAGLRQGLPRRQVRREAARAGQATDAAHRPPQLAAHHLPARKGPAPFWAGLFL